MVPQGLILTLLLLLFCSTSGVAAELGVVVRADSAAEISAGGKPRKPVAKEPLHIPAGERLRLTFKLADEFAGRAATDGRLSVRNVDSGAVAALQRAVAQHGLQFRRGQTASDAQLAGLLERAARMSGQAQPDLAGHLEVVTAAADRASVIAAARALHAIPQVEYVEITSLDAPPPPPASDIPPVTPLLVSQQTYRSSATGVNVDHVWDRFGVRGDSRLRVTDCEYTYNPNHEDLSDLVKLQPNVTSMYTNYGNDHGTAVLGVLASGWNEYGTTGGVPEAETHFYPDHAYLGTRFQDRTACITAAISASAAGDIVVLEMQTSGPNGEYVPAEYQLSVWNSVKAGSNAGVVVVAAAGNGNQNLDDQLYATYKARGDSGAIIVGAGSSARSKLTFSTFGSRVNLQGWGAGVFTTGYGAYATYGGDANQRYTNSFGGTSSATSIVASAAALLQSVALKILERRLSPAEIRTTLVNTGRAQTGTNASTAPIGPLPDLLAAVAALFAANPPTFSTTSSWGHYYFGTPTPDWLADVDGDGDPALLEYVLGTDPTSDSPADAARRPKVRLAAPDDPSSKIIFEFSQPATRTGASWNVQQSGSLEPNSWQTLTHGVNGTTISRNGDIIQVQVPNNSDRNFFRLKVSL